jgi:hypothetical protein
MRLVCVYRFRLALRSRKLPVRSSALTCKHTGKQANNQAEKQLKVLLKLM